MAAEQSDQNRVEQETYSFTVPPPWVCQRDSYLKSFTTTVKSCEPAEYKVSLDGEKAKKMKGFDVILEDTVLFAEGGGQSDDRGTVNGEPVHRISRRGADAVHFLLASFNAGDTVTQELDWHRRFDHMQQHSGQHLISAIIDTKYGYTTNSWWLGSDTCFVELGTDKFSAEQLAEVEQACNEAIRKRVPMTPLVRHKADPEVAHEVGGLPADHVGPVRVMVIDGIDRNLCCGTHVSNLADLQVVKLLGVEKGKKGKANLTFIVGNRVISYLDKSLAVSKQLTAVLKGNPEQHGALAEKAVKSQKAALKNCQSLLRDMAVMEAEKFKAAGVKGRVLDTHRKEGDGDYLNMVINEATSGQEGAVVWVTTGDDRGVGLFAVAAPDACLTALAPRVSELIEGKGAVKRGRLQGKAEKLQHRDKVAKLLREWVSQHQGGNGEGEKPGLELKEGQVES